MNPHIAAAVKPGRNDPCPCGSGRKYKQCCGAIRPPAPRAVAGPAGARPPRPAAQEAAAHNDRGLDHLRAHRLAEAARCFEEALACDPGLAVAHYNLAICLERRGDDHAAIAACQRAVKVNPRLADAHERLGNLLLAHGMRDEARDCFRRVAALTPDTALGRLNRAKVLHEEGRSEEAVAALRHAIARDPASGESHRFLGNVLRELGRFDEAIPCLERAIALSPEGIAAYYDLAHSRRLGETDRPLIGQLLSLLNSPIVADNHRAHLHFALGKAFDDLGDYEQAIGHFDEANRIARGGLRFDRGQFAVGVNRLIASYTPDFFAARAAQGTDSETPVLILGMPRSGTTLVEQILSSHPQIAAGDELLFWNQTAEAYARAGKDGATASRFAGIAADYQKLLREIGPQAARVTDKMPGNFLWIGLIHAVFPKARIIHCRRHPVDTCLSIYLTDFNWRKDFAYDRGDIVFYYRHYARLMAHWRKILPAERLIEVDYEALIADREAVTRRLVAFLGLDWDDACLRPESNNRPVRTASIWQARQPVYTTSVARWRRYEPWLGEFRQLLGDEERAPAASMTAAARQLAERLRREGRLAEAIALLEQAVRSDPEDAAAHNDLGLLLLSGHRVDEAVDRLERASALDPNLAVAHYNLGAALERQRRRGEAIAAYRRATALDPKLGAAHSRLGELLHAIGDRAGALDSFRRAAAAAPHSTLGRLSRVKDLLIEGDAAAAEAGLREAIARDPQSGEAQLLLGNLLRENGHFAEASACLERVIALDPDSVAACYALVQSRKIAETDRPLLGQMAALLDRIGLTDHERVLLHFALGKAFDDLGVYSEAIRHFDAGNRLERSTLSFDRAGFAKAIDRRIARFTPDFFAARAARAAECETPILIFGLPRSGTTLVEQILSSHAQVAGGGELTFWHERAAALAEGEAGALPPDVAAEYLSRLRRVSPDARRVTDTMPFNFLHLGLIHAVFPRAALIHCRRNPLDTCLSIYFSRFDTRQEFAYERGDLVFYYRHYARLMAHWRKILPPERLIEIDYEALIADREAVTRRLVAAVGLDWDAACLRPEDNLRPVNTASQWQVRQPVYDTSIGRWRHYEQWLGELRTLFPGPAQDEPPPDRGR